MNTMKEVKALIRSFAYAIKGICWGIRTQRNLRIHLVALLVICLFNTLAGFSPIHWAVELLCCMVVIAMELINSALEAACDAVTERHSAIIGHAKDAAAGAVLVSAIGSVAVALLIFFSEEQYGKNVLAFFTAHIWALPGLIILAVLAALFVFLPAVKQERERKK